MKVRDLLEENSKNTTLCQSRVITLNANNKNILFDTKINRPDYIEKFLDGNICSLWADIKPLRDDGYGSLYRAVIMIYVTNNSWKVTSNAEIY